MILGLENLNPRLNVSGPSIISSLDTGIDTVLVVEPGLNTAVTGDELKSSSTTTTTHHHCYWVTHGDILVAEGGVRRDGTTSTLIGLLRLPDTKETVTGIDPLASLPRYKLSVYSTCRTIVVVNLATNSNSTNTTCSICDSHFCSAITNC